MPTPDRHDLVFSRGDDFSQDLTMVVDEAGTTPMNVSDWSNIAAAVRWQYGVPTKVDLATSVVNATNGVIRIALTSTQTQGLPSSAVWDLERVRAGALQTVVAGSVTVKPTVTHT